MSKIIWIRDLLFELIKKDLKVKYKRSILGVFWSILNPLLMMVVMSIVFSYLFRFEIKNYPVYILSGIIFWNFFSTSTNLSSFSLISNASLLKKVYFPRAILVISVVLSQFINLLYALIPLVFIMIIFKTPVNLSIIFIIFPLLFLLLFTIGISLILSILSAYFTDIGYIYQIILLAWMYLTPIFYPASIVPDKYKIFLLINPIYHILTNIREIIYYGTLPTMNSLFISLIFSLSFFIFGLWFFKMNENKVMYLL
ncbi:ABC transporter permease [bacterium]|nr:ABC transporter permease [bacterium]